MKAIPSFLCFVALALLCSCSRPQANPLGDLPVAKPIEISLTQRTPDPALRFELVNGTHPEMPRTFLLDRATGRVWRWYANHGDPLRPAFVTEEGFVPLSVQEAR